MPDANSLLASLGLTKTEAAIYRVGLSRSPASATELSRRTGIKRPTVYHALETLMQKGSRFSERKRPASSIDDGGPFFLWFRQYHRQADRDFRAFSRAGAFRSGESLMGLEDVLDDIGAEAGAVRDLQNGGL